MLKRNDRAVTAVNRNLNSNKNKTLHTHRPIKSAGFIKTDFQAGKNVDVIPDVFQDGLRGKTILNLKTNETESKEEADKQSEKGSMWTPLYTDTLPSPRGSRLMLGSGKVKRTDNVENVELHLDNEEYLNLVDNTADDTKLDDIYKSYDLTFRGRGSETPFTSCSKRTFPLPKTYMTRSGSLLLYSDNKVMTSQKTRNINQDDTEHEIEVTGQRVSPRQSYPVWGKHIQQKKTSSSTEPRTNQVHTKRGQKSYIRLGGRGTESKEPYSWNYSVLPLKLIKLNQTETGSKHIRTVNNLSNAALDYQGVVPTVNDRYLAMIRQTRHRSNNHHAEDKGKQLQKLSQWTHEWIAAQDFLLLEEYKTVVSRYMMRKSASTDRRNKGVIQITLPKHQAPVNTPRTSTTCHLKTLSDDKK
ncbi:hypothetical protein ACF0H5_007693 [Mactra antiquata]